MAKSYKKLKFKHLTMQLYWQPGLIHAAGFITHIWRLLLGALVGWSVDPKKYWNFEKLKAMNLASGSVLAQGVTKSTRLPLFNKSYGYYRNLET